MWRHFKIKPVPQILARFEDALHECAVGLARHQGLDQVELVHRDELQDLGAEFSGGIAVDLPRAEFERQRDNKEWVIQFPAESLRVL